MPDTDGKNVVVKGIQSLRASVEGFTKDNYDMKRFLIPFVSAFFFLITQIGTAQTAVDLGLSVKWASCNVGALSPSEYGSYFAWGEVTSGKNEYSFFTLKYCRVNRGVHFSKYVPSGKWEDWIGRGAPDNKTRLELEDDAARSNWGGTWRTPSDSEWEELCTKCTWTWTQQSGKNGYKVTSKTNGNSIFLPAAGSRSDTRHDFMGDQGYYWSSSLGTNAFSARYMTFNSLNVHRDQVHRCGGYSIRPVCD